ncbi:hypothetical protein [Mesorhizobium sp. M1322]|uniref:hypothetical protein n=1 Tax=Mesorhizobium sp. M1322 TaxID=2957081 RepID=UPI00333C69F1
MIGAFYNRDVHRVHLTLAAAIIATWSATAFEAVKHELNSGHDAICRHALEAAAR